jgi:ferrous iron transport protein B
MVLLRTPSVILVGNPNTGKTTLFNALAGMNQRVGNYPGVTVETKKGKFRFKDESFELIDLPGTYSLAPRSPDEMLAVELILGQPPAESRPDVVVAIVDASNLERNLYLVTQLLELGVPVVVALNMMDVAARQGIAIDCKKLADKLGVPVIPMQANKGKGVIELKTAIVRAMTSPLCQQQPTFPEAFECEVQALSETVGNQIPPFLVRRLLLDIGGYTERFLGAEKNGLATQLEAARQRLHQAGCGVPAVEARTRYGWIRTATAGCVQRPVHRPVSMTDRLDRILTHKIWGMLVFLALMFLVFESIFFWAKPIMELIDLGKDKFGDLVKGAMPAGALRSLLVDGVIAGVGGVLVFLPQILILFAFIAILEDCGYMARAAFLMDKVMSRCGLNGKSFIPLLSSVACAVPGIMATRVIENRRDRLATILVAPLMSCSARLPVYLVLIGAFLTRGFAWWVPGLTLFAMYAIGLVVAPLVALVLKRTLLRGETPVFVMEMPLYKAPSFRLVCRRMFDSGWMFVRRAGTLILASMIVVWALLYFPSTAPNGDNYDLKVSELEERLAKPLEEKSSAEFDKKFALEELARLENQRDPGRKKAFTEMLELANAELDKLEKTIEPLQDDLNQLQRDWKGESILGQMGKALEPVIEPLGWDWRIGMAAIASFPAREVFVGTMGIIYNQGRGDSKDPEFRSSLGKALEGARWDSSPQRSVFTIPVALSVMVFFALCCQCASTLAVIRRETNSWRWPIFTFVYMTLLAYVGALVTYQVGSLLI